MAQCPVANRTTCPSFEAHGASRRHQSLRTNVPVQIPILSTNYSNEYLAEKRKLRPCPIPTRLEK